MRKAMTKADRACERTSLAYSSYQHAEDALYEYAHETRFPKEAIFKLFRRFGVLDGSKPMSMPDVHEAQRMHDRISKSWVAVPTDEDFSGSSLRDMDEEVTRRWLRDSIKSMDMRELSKPREDRIVTGMIRDDEVLGLTGHIEGPKIGMTVWGFSDELEDRVIVLYKGIITTLPETIDATKPTYDCFIRCCRDSYHTSIRGLYGRTCFWSESSRDCELTSLGVPVGCMKKFSDWYLEKWLLEHEIIVSRGYTLEMFREDKRNGVI